jgi:tetratricopeptide (TPR) repeat protein
MTAGISSTGRALAEARDAFGQGDLARAVAILRSHLRDNRDPEARLDLARLLLPHGAYDEAREQLETAFRELTEAGATRRAALAASHLGALYVSWIGNQVAGRAWLARAWRMIEREGPCLERGWIATWDVGCQYDDPDDLRRRAEIALETARSFGDPNLETKALADGGLSMVEAGEIDAGMERLDEAMALATSGYANDALTAGQATCSFFVACWWTGDLSRLESWCEPLRQRGLIGDQGFPILTTHCDAVYGTLLCSVGRLDEAEAVLARLEHGGEQGPAAIRLRRAWGLAELRIRQGRLNEAEQLLLGFDDVIEGLVPMARLHLARGDHELAAGAARRGLRLIGSDRVRAAQLLAVLVEAELGHDDLDAAREAADELEACARTTRSAAVLAEAGFASACVQAASGDNDGAIASLDSALERLGDTELPLLRAQLRLELARLHCAHDRGAALVEARAAAAIHSRLQIPIAREYADVLRDLGVDVPVSGGKSDGAEPGAEAVLSRRADRSWTVTRRESSFRLRDTKGLRYLGDLIEHPGIERHVLDLVELADPGDADGAATRQRLGDAGAVIDAQAKAAYRRRIEQLREEVQEAQTFGHYEKAAALQREVDAIVHELAAALGIGGRDRRVASAAERARLNVSRAIRASIARIGEWDDQAGRALDQDISTGTYCSYQPRQDSAIRWRTGWAARGSNGSRPAE